MDEYVLVANLRASTSYLYRRTVQLYSTFLGRPAGLRDLTDQTVNRWLLSLEATHSQVTIAGHRTVLLILWRDLARRGLVDPPRRVRRVTRPEPSPIAWTIAEARQILEQARRLRGRFPSGAGRAAYCEALILVVWDTGLRRSDAWSVRRDMVRPDGTVVLRQAKTGRAHWPRLRPETLRQWSSLPGDPPLRCPYRSRSAFYRFWRRDIIAAAGVRSGALQQLRRSGATHLAALHPDAVQQYLGHRTPTMQRHYVDRSIAHPQQHLPPELS